MVQIQMSMNTHVTICRMFEDFPKTCYQTREASLVTMMLAVTILDKANMVEFQILVLLQINKTSINRLLRNKQAAEGNRFLPAKE